MCGTVVYGSRAVYCVGGVMCVKAVRYAVGWCAVCQGGMIC